jgi:hypothetical protein
MELLSRAGLFSTIIDNQPPNQDLDGKRLRRSKERIRWRSLFFEFNPGSC